MVLPGYRASQRTQGFLPCRGGGGKHATVQCRRLYDVAWLQGFSACRVSFAYKGGGGKNTTRNGIMLPGYRASYPTGSPSHRWWGVELSFGVRLIVICGGLRIIIPHPGALAALHGQCACVRL